jgi:tripartite-type tricarboxylate transporter receptor subunit TctC
MTQTSGLMFGLLALLIVGSPAAQTTYRPDLRAKLADLGLEAIGNSPDEFAAIIKSETPKWAQVIKESGIKPD